MEHPVLILGVNSIGKSSLEILLKNDVVVYGFLDEELEEDAGEVNGVAIIGSYEEDAYLSMIADRCEYFVASDETSFKKHLAQRIEEEYKKKAINIISASANIASDCKMGHGNLIEAGTNLQAGSSIGEYCNIKINAIIGVETEIGDYVHIGKSATIGDGVVLEEGVFVGSGAVLVDGVKIGKNARIGAGAVVVSSVEEGQTLFGNPAKEI